MDRILVICLITLAFSAACSIKVTTPARALISNKTKLDVFDAVTQACSESEFTILSMNERTGFISASRAGGILSNKDISINCTVKKTPQGEVQVDVTSTLTGQIVGYGATKDAIRTLFKRLLIHLPNAKLTIDGKPFNKEENGP